MDELIDTLLTLAREGQTIDPGDLEPVGLEAVARAAWETVETKAATLETEDALGELRADRTRLRELLENLYRNAVEHAGSDVTVTIGWIDGGDMQQPGGFYVADDGTGIPAEKRADVFESGYTTSSDGTGLGLSIVTDFAEAHGWTVELAESIHGGVRFEFRGIETP
jgi:signal transduction histidine kinase